MSPVGSGLGPEDLTVTGGVAGLAATYDRILGLADLYDDLGDRLRQRARVVLAATLDGGLLASAVLAPVSFARVEGALVAAATGPDGITATVAGWETDAIAVRACVAGLRVTDSAAEEALASVSYRLGALAGPPLIGLIGLVGLGGLGVAAGAPLALRALPAAAGLVPAYGGTAGMVRRLDGLMADEPWLVTPTVLATAGAVDALTGPPGLAAATWPDGVGTGRATGLLAAAYGPEGPPVVRARPDLEPTSITPPRDVGDLLGGLASTAALAREAPGTIAVDTLTGPDGARRHVVHLPGTDDMSTLPWTRDEDARDLGANLRLMAGPSAGPTTYGAGVLAAMAAAGVAPGEPTLLTGHSQGGMQAVALAARADGHGFDLRQVVTAGAPTAQVPDLPPGVSVLSFENRGDAVPLLDGAPNPDTPERVTVTFDAPTTAAEPEGIAARHALRTYLEVSGAVDASEHPSLLEQRTRMADLGFLDAVSAERHVFAVTR